MKAAVYKQPNKIEIKEIEKPKLDKKGAIIKVLGCGLCGSDIVKIRQDLVSGGTVLGHEVVGIVEEIDSETDFKVGDKVVLGHHVPCFNCAYCRGESYSMCRIFKDTNITPGGFCEHIYVTEEHLNHTVAHLPEGIDEVQASFMEPAACCLRAVRRANIKPGDNVLILGLGSIGLIMGQIVKHFGANVCGCDLMFERLQLAKEVGFDSTLKFQDNESSSEFYKSISDLAGADKVFLTSGSEKTFPFALACVRDGGTLVVFSSVHSYSEGFANNDIYYRELNVMGSYSPAPADLHDSLELIQKGIIKVEYFARKYSLEDLQKAVEDTCDKNILKAFIEIEA